MLCTRYILEFKDLLNDDALVAGASALSNICSTEHFSTYQSEHISREDMVLIIELNATVLTELCRRQPEARKGLRTLIDFAMRCSRMQGRK